MINAIGSVLAGAAILVGCVASAAAAGASWPITSTVDYPAPQTIDLDRAKATVHVTVGDDAADIDVEVYGVDGMRAGDDNRVRGHRDRLRKGEDIAFEVTIHPGRGRSYLVVSAKARFAHAGTGSTVLNFPFGEESAEQQRDHTRCVRQDPDGIGIREPGCDAAAPPSAVPASTPSRAPAAAPPAATSSAVISVAQFRASPPHGRVARLLGYVVESYRCPPCPRGAQCKPCATQSAIFLADSPAHVPFSLDAPPADIAAVATDEPERFERGIQYQLEIAVTGRRRDRLDGRLMRSQRPDRGPIWADPR